MNGAQDSTTIPGSRSATDPERRLPRGRHDLPREFVARTQRDRLIDAMARTVADRGYHGASLGAVCSAAGVSTKAFYQYFSDKESCFLAAFERGVSLLQGSVVAAYSVPGPWPTRIRRGLGTLLQILSAEPAFAALSVVEVMAAGPRALACRRVLLASYRHFFDDAPREADGPVAPEVAVEAVISGVYGVIFEYVATGRTARLPECLPDLTYFLLAPFIGREAAATYTGPFPDDPRPVTGDPGPGSGATGPE